MPSILLVDDDVLSLQCLGPVLDNQGYSVVTAESAPTAVARVCVAQAAHLSIDLAIVDVMMAPVDGITLARKLRAMYPALQILFVSGYPRVDIEARFGPLTAPFLQKPFSLREFMDTIAALFHGVA